MPRVVVAPNTFKGSLSAAGVAAAVSAGIRRARPDAEVVSAPVADGGDGTVEAAVASGFGRVPVTAPGPLGDPVHTAYARRGDVAVVELADVCGLARLPSGALRPWTASTRGLGSVVAAALDAGCRSIVVGIGGSASTDGGAGMLAALGARVSDRAGRPIADGAAGLAAAARLELGALHPGLRDAAILVASDVDNPLTGPSGAAAVYGPQKGLRGDDVAAADAALGHWADLVADTTGADVRHQPGAGAAGGVGFAALAVLGARLEPGIDVILALTGFAERLAGCSLVVTGEGSLDEQSLHGKAPIGVAAAARELGVPVVAVCGRRLLDDAALAGAGIVAAYPLTDVEPDPAVCVRDAERLLVGVGEHVGRDHLGGP